MNRSAIILLLLLVASSITYALNDSAREDGGVTLNKNGTLCKLLYYINSWIF